MLEMRLNRFCSVMLGSRISVVWSFVLLRVALLERIEACWATAVMFSTSGAALQAGWSAFQER
jgi:hypothetical protein